MYCEFFEEEWYKYGNLFDDFTLYSFILIKPDALGNIQLNNDLDKYISEYNLNIINTYDITISKFHINNLWPIYQHCNLTRIFIEKYLMNNLCKVILLYGDNALSKVALIKKNIRKKYSTGFFSNCLHAPSDILENEVDLNILLNNISNKTKNYQLMKGLWGRFSNFNENEIKDLIDRIWRYKEQYGWDMIYNNMIETEINNNSCCTYIKIFDDKDHSIDEFVSSIYEIFHEEINTENVIISVLEIYRRGEIILNINNDFELDKKVDCLNTLGIKSIILENTPNIASI